MPQPFGHEYRPEFGSKTVAKGKYVPATRRGRQVTLLVIEDEKTVAEVPMTLGTNAPGRKCDDRWRSRAVASSLCRGVLERRRHVPEGLTIKRFEVRATRSNFGPFAAKLEVIELEIPVLS
jgi:hypothetical protein